MRRSEALEGLSREHHHALVLARRLRQATSANADVVTRSFLAAWHARERRHLEIEEEVLVPSLAHHGLAAHPAIRRMRVEHVAIRRRAEELDQAPAHAEVLRALGRCLNEHVRHEERTVFPLVEASLSLDALHALGEALRRAEGKD